MNYYVLFVKGKEELRVCEFMNAYCSNWDVSFPMMEKFYRRKGMDEVVLRPLFPCYVFVRTKMDAKSFHDLLFSLRGQFSGLIRELEYENDEIPALMDYEVDFLERVLDDDGILKISRGVICDGVLKVVTGPLMGLERYISFVDRHKRLAFFNTVFHGRDVCLKFGLEVVDKF